MDPNCEVLVNVIVVPWQIVVCEAVKSAIGGVAIPVPFNTKLKVPSSQSFVTKETLPVKLPAVAGEKVTVNVVDVPGATLVVPNPAPKENPVPVTVIGFVKVSVEVPVLFIVKVAVVEPPTCVFAKL